MLIYFPKDLQLAPSRAIRNKAPPMDFQQELQTTNFYLFDEFEYEDDVFYCEFREQVLELTAEDEEEEPYENKKSNMARKQSPNYGPCGVSQDRGYYNWPGNKVDHAAPAWILNLWRSGNGTGVFIPQIVQSKKKTRTSTFSRENYDVRREIFFLCS